MKRLFSAILSITFLFSTVTALAENNTKEMERLLVSVKNRIGDTSDFPEFSSDAYTSGKENSYNFSWSASRDEDYKSLNVSCNSQGVITYYHSYNSKKITVSKPLSIKGTKRADALKIAKEEVKKLNPDIADKLVVFDTEPFESFRKSDYIFRIQRYENNIPVLSDTGRITLDSDCTLINFHLSYTTGLDFENAENTIEKDAAKDSYIKNIGTDLYYMTNYSDSGKESIRLVYAPKNDSKYIHAVTGNAIEVNDLPPTTFNNMKEEALTMDSASGSSYREQLSDAELKTVLEVEDLLSKEEASSIIKNCRYFGISDDAKLESSSLYYNNSVKAYVYNFSYNHADKYANAGINAKTGEIISFSKWGDIPQDAVSDTDKIKSLSKEIINELAPEKAGEFRLNETPSGFGATFTRYKNDIPFYENTVSMSFDNEYNLTRYRISYSDVDFPAPENIITPEEAFNVSDKSGDYKIYYITDSVNKKFIPVYTFTESHIIDAHTGKALYESLTNATGGSYTDISGHYAEEKIKVLASYGIFLDGTELKPDETITQKDFAALLSIIFYSGDISVLRSTYLAENLYKTLPKNLFSADEINPTAPLTRLTAAKLMVKALGAEEYAKMSHIYAPLYKDVTEDIGYVNILTGLNVISGDGTGYFNPEKEITKAQALIMIYNYLSR